MDAKANHRRGFWQWAVGACDLLLAVAWMDKKPVHLLSSAHGTGAWSVKRKNSEGVKEDVNCPEPLAQYVEGMYDKPSIYKESVVVVVLVLVVVCSSM